MNDRADGFPLDGRILILGTAPRAVEHQLAGQDLTLAEAGPLRDKISTNEITPLPALLHYGKALARESHTGTRIGNDTPLVQGVFEDSAVTVLVAGYAMARGASREHAPLSEYLAGVRGKLRADLPAELRQYRAAGLYRYGSLTLVLRTTSSPG